jgi:hypothetical protein
MAQKSLREHPAGELFHTYLLATAKLHLMQQGVEEHQKLVLAPITEKVRAVLKEHYGADKLRAEFSLDTFSPEEKKLIGEDCTGLRLGKRSRKEYQSSEKILQALVNSFTQRLRARIPQITDQDIKAFADEVAADLSNSRETKVSWDVMPIRKIGKKDGRKRKHVIAGEEDDEDEAEHVVLRASQKQQQPPFSLSQSKR